MILATSASSMENTSASNSILDKFPPVVSSVTSPSNSWTKQQHPADLSTRHQYPLDLVTDKQQEQHLVTNKQQEEQLVNNKQQEQHLVTNKQEQPSGGDQQTSPATGPTTMDHLRMLTDTQKRLEQVG